MGIWEILLLGVALSMDACAVAMTNGMTDKKMGRGKALLIGGFFGFFQFLMPVIGYFITGVVAETFLDTFESISAWLAFGVLALLGGKMLFENVRELLSERKKAKYPEGVAPCGEEADEKCGKLSLWTLFLQAVATSIDALAVGITLQMAAISSGLALGGVWGATAAIGGITFLLSVFAVYLGKWIGDRLASKAGLFGGAVLVLIGVKVLLEGIL